ncbi:MULTISPECIES: bifunctional adenosylcobinamide kinase/adenosylcobinamide-phosphate guanylyltransferase [unclassified Rhizobium]|uniref:bifunctional adenosylcobinamide kinase/adenosylcobinamide-phosphate guanylyltransferase n=1 Tax=unclassified Rhizobium TaxID=2613769 RepID=UPI0006FCC565|nr:MULTISPECIES: bifunctional adenosylcobinamide kinase/adenosylcobinamide-phosphate guanylyltransferase [unclassified Rhizobium]KQV34663.1 adenosylcobinamide kinase/adenosylcobinamide phosphate guanyltransferase [Rhizobium sp. Root1212]KRD23998.1 adenosylcobinamide kinase/adenosylcobinamide phosphate guanyltransferase [Rhizobium sp. Root268]
MTSRSVLVLGGARSGKSSFAENLVTESRLGLHYIATGRAWDDEMRERIRAHQEQRGEGWITHEEPVDLVGKLSAIDAPDRAVLVDCLTLWVTNLMLDERAIPAECARLVDLVSRLKARVVFVSNEVGLGIVPENRMARDFRDHAGRLHQSVAAQCAEVYFIAAGLPLKMKG